MWSFHWVQHILFRTYLILPCTLYTLYSYTQLGSCKYACIAKMYLIFSFGNYKLLRYSFLSLGTIHLYFDPNGCQSYLFNVPELEPAVDDCLLLRAGLFSHQLPTLRLSLWLSQWTRLSYTACGRVVTSFRHPALRTKLEDRAREKPQRFESYVLGLLK